MLRGRHRGLPVAIDRAVILPFEFREAADAFSERQPDIMSQRRSSQESVYQNGTYNGTINGTDNAPSEKLQRRSWRTSSPESTRRRSDSRGQQSPAY